MDLEDKVIVITGATGGIGYELCKKLDEKGARIIAIGRTLEKLDKLKKELGNKDNIYISCDFTITSQLSNAVDKISANVDKIDLLVNAAGVGVYKSLEDVEMKEWEESVAINVNAPFFMMKKLLRLLKKSDNAVVVNIGSGMGEIPTACRSVYCATKYALRGLTLSLSAEYVNSNVHFVHLALGSVLTDFGPLTLDEKKEENLKGKSYLTPDGVAARIIHILENNELQDEVKIYPTGYEN